MDEPMDVGEKRVLAQFKNEDGALVGTPFDLPLDVTRESLALLCNAVLKNVRICMRARDVSRISMSFSS